MLIRLTKYVDDPKTKDIALSSLAYSMKYQNEDGSWYYAQTDYQKWIDSFHTGFNLQCVKYFLDGGFGAEYKDSFDRGLEFYIDNFFLNGEVPKYYHDKIYPLDIHSAAQAVVLFSKLNASLDSSLQNIRLSFGKSRRVELKLFRK